jgi:hypothetical protein
MAEPRFVHFIRHVAVEQFVADSDGFLGDAGMAISICIASATATDSSYSVDKSEAFKPG